MSGRIGGSNKVLSMRQAAEKVGRSYYSFARHYKEWKIPHHRVGGKVVSGRMRGGRVTFRERDLEAFLDRTREK